MEREGEKEKPLVCVWEQLSPLYSNLTLDPGLGCLLTVSLLYLDSPSFFSVFFMFQHILTLLNVNIHTHIHTYTSICLKGSYLINNSSLVSLYNSPWAPLSFSFLDYYTFLFCIFKKSKMVEPSGICRPCRLEWCWPTFARHKLRNTKTGPSALGRKNESFFFRWPSESIRILFYSGAYYF